MHVRVYKYLPPLTTVKIINNHNNDARLDIVAGGLWGGRFERTYFDVRVFNPYAPSATVLII